MAENANQNGADNTAGQDGADSHWTDTLTNETHKANETLKGFASIDDFVQSHVDMVAANEAQPKPPEGIDGYEFTVPEGYQISDDAMNAFKEFCLENGVSSDLFSKLMAYDVQRSKSAAEAANTASQEAHDKSVNDMKQALAEGNDEKWNQMVQKNGEFFNMIQTKLQGFDVAKLLGSADPSGKFPSLADNPAFFQFVNFIASSTDEDTFGGSGNMPNQGGIKKDSDGSTVFHFPDMKK